MISRRFFVAFGVVLAAACAGHNAAPTNSISGEGNPGVARLRAVATVYRNLDSAVAVGYPRTVADCLVHEHHGAMGYHHVNRTYLAHDIVVEKPQILLYERMPDNSYRLNAVEYIIPYRLWPRDSIAPQMMGQTMHQEDNLKIWYLHVWAWRNNPGGIFANFHPDVQCPDSTRKVYTPFPAEAAGR